MASPALKTIVQLENSYAGRVAEQLTERDRAISRLRRQQTSELEAAVQQLSSTLSERTINNLATEQLERLEVLADNWDSSLRNLKHHQRREMRSHAASLYASLKSGALTQHLASEQSPLAQSSQHRSASITKPEPTEPEDSPAPAIAPSTPTRAARDKVITSVFTKSLGRRFASAMGRLPSLTSSVSTCCCCCCCCSCCLTYSRQAPPVTHCCPRWEHSILRSPSLCI